MRESADGMEPAEERETPAVAAVPASEAAAQPATKAATQPDAATDAIAVAEPLTMADLLCPKLPLAKEQGGARGCANAAPAAMPPPTEAREGCSGLVGDACARQLDGGVDGRRPPYRRR